MAGKADGSVIIDTRMNTSGFSNGIANMKKGFNGISSALGKLAKVMIGVFAVKKLAEFGKDAIELGSDLSEVQNVVDVTFENLNGEINEFASNAIEQFGLSETAAKQYSSTMGAMLKSMGFTTREAANMSMTMTGLAADMASFYNLNAEDAFYKIRAGISGETEPLKQLGINLNVANLEQYAFTQGITKSYNAMTQQEQAFLRYNYLLEVTADAQGDFSRTSESWANQTRILSERFKALKATIGQGLINVFTPVLKIINVLLSRLQTVANAFKAFSELITGKKASSGGGGSSVIPAEDYTASASGAEDYAEAQNDAAEATKNARKETDKYLSGLDEVKKYDLPETDTANSGSGSGSVGGMTSGGTEVDYGSLTEGETVVDKLSDKLLAFKNVLTGLFKPFSDAWSSEGQRTIEAASNALSNIGKLAKSVGKSFYDVWTNGTGATILSTILQIAQNILITVGNLSGRFAEAWNKSSIGTSIMQEVANIIQFIFDFTNKIVLATARWAASLNFSPLLESIHEFLQAVLPLVQDIGNWLTSIYTNIILPLANYIIKTALPGIISAISRLLSFLSENQWIIEGIGAVLIGAFASKKIVPLIMPIVKAVKKIISILIGKGGLVKAITSIVSALGGPLTIAIASVIAIGVLLWKNWDTIKTKAIEIWSAIKNWFFSTTESIRQFFSNLWSGIAKTFQNVGSWFKDKFNEAYSNIKNIFSNAGSFFAGVWSGIKDAFGNIAEWFRSKFLEAWTAVKNVFSVGGSIFSGIKDGILSSLKSVINALIRGINTVISIPFNGINNALNRIRNIKILGTKPFNWISSIGVPQIPYLATGAVIPPNAPFMAVLGDQKKGNNIETPEALLRRIIREETGGQGAGNSTYTFIGQINRRTLFEEMMTEAQLVRGRTGRNPFEMA